MSFTPSIEKEIPWMGNPNARLMIIGDCPSEAAYRNNKPLVAPAEGVLEACLHQGGLIKGDTYIINAVPDNCNSSKFWNERTKRPKVDISKYKEVLYAHIDKVKPKVIATLGNLPAYILTGNGEIAKTRGYPFKCLEREHIIVVPTYHPSNMIWGNYLWRYYCGHDFKKAKDYLTGKAKPFGPEIKTTIPFTYAEARELLLWARRHTSISIDIEVTNYEVSCISFATIHTNSFSIPFDMRWTLEEEVGLWQLVANIMEDETITKIGQNFIFDIYFLLYRNSIFTRGKIIDTMMAHSILYPEYLKSLNFLGSIYTNQAYWKGMVSFKDIKKES